MLYNNEEEIRNTEDSENLDTETNIDDWTQQMINEVKTSEKDSFIETY